MLVLAGPTVAAGGLGFLVVLALIVGAVFLFRSMNRHLKNVPASFEEPGAEPLPEQPAAPSAGSPQP